MYPSADLPAMRQKFMALKLRASRLEGQVAELHKRHANVSSQLSLTKAQAGLEPLVKDALRYLQEKAHRRAVGDFEDLLSDFVNDVMPGVGRIEMVIGTERGAPSLDIYLNNGGDRESIIGGNGGGLTNIVVVGLSFSALARTQNRQFLTLDEPDCWLKAPYVPAFTKVIADVANPREDETGNLTGGCQTLMISHNDISLMDEGAHIHELRVDRSVKSFAAKLGLPITYKGEPSPCAYVVYVPEAKGRPASLEVRYRNDAEADEEQNALTRGFPYIASTSGAKAWRSNSMEGIRWIQVENMQSHVWTKLEMSPGLNVVTGDLNVGKSNLVFTAVRALAYGDSEDTLIRHGADAATIRIGLENDIVLEMTRRRSGSPKVMYRRYEGGKLVNEGRQENRGCAPDFIQKVLRIEKADDLDIQLRSQKSPVFLLDEPASKRAKLLSVGKEMGLLQHLMEHYNRALRKDKEYISLADQEVAELSRKLKAMSALNGFSTITDALSEELDALAQGAEQLATLRKTIAHRTLLSGKHHLGTVFATQVPQLPVLPETPDTANLVRVLKKLKATQLKAQLPNVAVVPDLPSDPTAERRQKLASLMASLKMGKGKAALAQHSLPQVPSYQAESPAQEATLRRLIKALEQGACAEAALARLPALPPLPATVDTAGLRDLLEKFQKLTAIGKELRSQEKAASAALEKSETALHNLMTELDVCPLCNHTLTGEIEHA